MKRDVFDPEHMRGMVPGFHSAVRQDGVVFIAGQVGLDRDLKVVEGGLAQQTRQALGNLREVLELAAVGPSDLTQMMIFYKHTEDLVIADALTDFVAAKNEVLPGSGPVGFACSVHGLLFPELLVEVQAIAMAS
ncbi:RidA family protein [Pseudonocardia asaccharolytica]|uniref:Enamine deaminase RidA n=1 Tax=Pseudonocardia asaccharolytica DSM 44247 = NBRC 16224 TaxID=1123024 RepID=A0A511CXD3_9PSEU|nr:RidA family protein [Pseudonocardia asaccharolytica]GEL17219.1 enamine deaminase RidA [Pseudonocardia asaccharolytica DSM 44247 = NBRC 16224]